MKKNKLFWILTVVCVLNFAAHLYFYPSLPDIVPTHWGADGQVNGWGPKSTVLILAALPFAMLILFEVIPKSTLSTRILRSSARYGTCS